jgi:glucose-6-phosphate isomerase
MRTRHRIEMNLGDYRGMVEAALTDMENTEAARRIWSQDYTFWKPDPTDISNRMGWLHTADVMQENLHEFHALAEAAVEAGYKRAVVLGMGGSSLAPEVFAKTFAHAERHPELSILDSTVPGAVLACQEQSDPSEMLFVVSSKSGTTVETLAFFRHFYNWVEDEVGGGRAGDHFIAITDPGTPLVETAERYGFRATVLNDSTIGGRYSVLSHFGLVPAALMGVDLDSLLRRAQAAQSDCGPERPVADNPGLRLGAALGELAKAGRDKLTLIASPAIASFGGWIEQLIAESTGKEGTGIIPVNGEPVGAPSVYGEDRVFAYLQMEGEAAHETAVAALEGAGHPVIRFTVHDHYDLGRAFFIWEMATAVAGSRLGINPFNQPNVESTKKVARELVAEYRKQGSLPSEEPALREGEMEVYGTLRAEKVSEALGALLELREPGAYVSLQAYIEPTAEAEAALARLAERIRDRSRLATTIGYGPRFLHSTGQLHKGDAGKGLFVQLTADDPQEVAIPDEAGKPDSSLGFGVLKDLTAAADRRALLEAGRRVVRFHLGRDACGGIERLTNWLG